MLLYLETKGEKNVSPVTRHMVMSHPQRFWCKEYNSLYLLIFITLNTNWSRRKILYAPLLPFFMAKYRNPMEPIVKFLLAKETFIAKSSLHRKTTSSHTTEITDSTSKAFRKV